MSDIIEAKQEQTRQPHRWKKGETGNPNGRPKNPEAVALREAIRIARKKFGGVDILTHFVRRAYYNDAVLIALIKKIIPDKASPEKLAEILNIDNKNITVNFIGATNGTGHSDSTESNRGPVC